MATRRRARTGAGATTRTCTPTGAGATTRTAARTRAGATTRTGARTRAAQRTDVVDAIGNAPDMIAVPGAGAGKPAVRPLGLPWFECPPRVT